MKSIKRSNWWKKGHSDIRHLLFIALAIYNGKLISPWIPIVANLLCPPGSRPNFLHTTYPYTGRQLSCLSRSVSHGDVLPAVALFLVYIFTSDISVSTTAALALAWVSSRCFSLNPSIHGISCHNNWVFTAIPSVAGLITHTCGLSAQPRSYHVDMCEFLIFPLDSVFIPPSEQAAPLQKEKGLLMDHMFFLSE